MTFDRPNVVAKHVPVYIILYLFVFCVQVQAALSKSLLVYVGLHLELYE